MISKQLNNLDARLSIILISSTLFILTVASIVTAVCPKPADIKPCTCDDEGVRCVKLNNSGLAKVFKAPAELAALKGVWIFQTNLTNLPKKAFGDYIIRDLFLDINQIRSIESGAFGKAAQKLETLSLTRNLLTSFPFKDLRYMIKLRKLGLGHNKLTEIPTNSFPPSDSLDSVDLSHNHINRIQANALAGLSEVTKIDLSRNKLDELGPNSLFVNTTKPLSISLRSNSIKSLAPGTFGNNRQAKLEIDLSRNRLTYLNESLFLPLLLGKTIIDVDENSFTCFGCNQYRWLIDVADRTILDGILNFVCPDDTKLEDLTLDMIGCYA